MKNDIVYLDDDHNIVDKDVATRAIIREYDESGNLVNEVFMVKKEESETKLTEEEIKILEKFEIKYGSNLKK